MLNYVLGRLLTFIPTFFRTCTVPLLVESYGYPALLAKRVITTNKVLQLVRM